MIVELRLPVCPYCERLMEQITLESSQGLFSVYVCPEHKEDMDEIMDRLH